VERPVVSSVGHRFTRQELDFISPERWQALLAEQHEVDELEAAYEARRRRQPELKEISYERCVSCGAEVWGHNAVKDLRAPGRYRCQRCAAKL
jgi:DNA-directed RNA polymerase subunit RPC12/RpoP